MSIKNTRAAPKKIAHIIYALFLIMQLLFVNTIIACAEEIEPSDYRIKEVTEEEVEKDLLHNNMVVYFRDSDDVIRGGNAYDVFCYLKTKNKNEINPQYSMKWRLINSQEDRLDAIAFYGEANFGNANILNYMIDNITGTVMQFTDAELVFITQYFSQCVPIFCIMIILYIMKALAELVSHNKASTEEVLKIFLLGLISAWAISKADKIVTIFFSISNSFMTTMSSIINPERVGFSNVYSYEDIVLLAMGCDGNSAWDSIGKVSNSVLHVLWGQILLFIVLIVLTVMTYSVKLKFSLRALFLPFAMTSLPYKGKNSNAVKHLKKMGANALLAGIYTVILSFGIYYNSSFSASSGQSSLMLTFVIPFVILLSMKVADMISEEVINTI